MLLLLLVLQRLLRMQLLRFIESRRVERTLQRLLLEHIDLLVIAVFIFIFISISITTSIYVSIPTSIRTYVVIFIGNPLGFFTTG